MSKTITGTFQKPDGTAVAFGTLYLKLIQDATVIGTGQIVPATPLAFPLDANGTLGSGVTIFASDELTPTGISYVLTVSENGGGQVYGPEFFIISGASPINLNNLTPSANSPVVFSGAVLLSPTALQTITGFPLAAPAFQSPNANPAATGIVRLATGDSLNWRNNANNADVVLSKNTSDNLAWQNGVQASFYQTQTTNPSTTFQFRLASTDGIGWRNNANSGDVALGKNSNDSLTFAGFVAPQTVAAVNLTAQAAAIGSTLLYAVPASGAGLYRASFTMYTTTAGAGNGQAGLAWNNGNASKAFNSPTAINLAVLGDELADTASPFVVITFFSAASQNINYSTIANPTAGAQYALRIRLEYLG